MFNANSSILQTLGHFSPSPCASLSKGFSPKIAAKILWVMAAHKVGCGPFPPPSIYHPPLPSKTTPWPGHSSHSAHFLRRISPVIHRPENDTRASWLAASFFSSRSSSYNIAFRFEKNGKRFFDLYGWNEIFSAPPISPYPYSIRFSEYRYRLRGSCGYYSIRKWNCQRRDQFQSLKKKFSSFFRETYDTACNGWQTNFTIGQPLLARRTHSCNLR